MTCRAIYISVLQNVSGYDCCVRDDTNGWLSDILFRLRVLSAQASTSPAYLISGYID